MNSLSVCLFVCLSVCLFVCLFVTHMDCATSYSAGYYFDSRIVHIDTVNLSFPKKIIARFDLFTPTCRYILVDYNFIRITKIRPQIAEKIIY